MTSLETPHRPRHLRRTRHLSPAGRVRRSAHSGRLRGAVASAVAAGLLLGAGASTATYTVRPGDTLTAIAHRLGVSTGAFVRANHLRDANFIEQGQVLVVPGGDAGRYGGPAGGGSGFGKAFDPLPWGQLPSALRHNHRALRMRSMLRIAAWRAGVPAPLLEALTWQESGWQQGVVSSTGAIGFGQLEPATTDFVNQVLLGGRHLNPKRTADNVLLTATLLHYLLRESPDTPSAIGAYYQGLALMRSHGPLNETLRYIADIEALVPGFQPG